MVSFFAIAGLLNGIGAVILGIIVLLKKEKTNVHRVFALLNLAIAIWAFSYWRWLLTDSHGVALFWTRILSIGSTLIPIFFLHWILLVVDKAKEKKTLLIGGYLMTAAFLLFSFSSLFVKDVAPLFSFPFWPVPGILYHFYVIFSYILLLGYGVYQLFIAYRGAAGHKKAQMKYIFLGLAIAAPAGFSNFPLWYKINLPPYLNIFVLFYMGCYAYAILKKQLLDIKVVLTQLLVILIAGLLLINVISAESTFEYVWKGGLFVVFLVFGWLLVKSVIKEIKHREEIDKYATQLSVANVRLKEAYKKVRKLDKAKSEFVSIASHQLRTPLTAVKGYISMLLEGDYGKLPGDALKPMRNVYESNERLINLVNSLLNISRIEAGKLKVERAEFSLELMLEDLLQIFKRSADAKKLKLHFEKPKGKIPLMNADQQKLRQVFSNLLDNAIKYTQQGSITLRLESLKNKVRITMTDTGVGMTKEEMTKLFQTFSRTGAGKRFWMKGAGLGLYVAKKFVQMHKGKIWATSLGKDKGSTFHIELPLK